MKNMLRNSMKLIKKLRGKYMIYKNLRNNKINVGGVPVEVGETIEADPKLKEIKTLVLNGYLEEVKVKKDD